MKENAEKRNSEESSELSALVPKVVLSDSPGSFLLKIKCNVSSSLWNGHMRMCPEYKPWNIYRGGLKIKQVKRNRPTSGWRLKAFSVMPKSEVGTEVFQFISGLQCHII